MTELIALGPISADEARQIGAAFDAVVAEWIVARATVEEAA